MVEAIKVRDALKYARRDWKKLPKWLAAWYEKGRVVFGNASIYINTLEGKMEGGIEDWIIEGVLGEIYTCKPDIFAATYEAVDEPEKLRGEDGK